MSSPCVTCGLCQFDGTQVCDMCGVAQPWATAFSIDHQYSSGLVTRRRRCKACTKEERLTKYEHVDRPTRTLKNPPRGPIPPRVSITPKPVAVRCRLTMTDYMFRKVRPDEDPIPYACETCHTRKVLQDDFPVERRFQNGKLRYSKTCIDCSGNDLDSAT